MEQQIVSVTQLNQYLKNKLEADPLLLSVGVQGELSNYKVYPSGHHYFTLKDSEASLKCVMFRGSATALRFRPENGMSVYAFGRISVYPRDGAYQLYCTRLSPGGMGDLHLAFEQLKQKLDAEGLFAAAHKKPIPVFPHTIAVITSSAGAAVHDMLRILNRRYPLSKVKLLPVRVQGAEAPPEIVGAIRYANRHRLADVLIVGRGGGSIEDLWAFNDERVARAIYASEIPVISAVGHEPDVTISDYVADLRAATPSNAAELAAPDQMKLRERLNHAALAMQKAVQHQIALDRQRVQRNAASRVLQNPVNYVQDKRLRLDAAHQRLLQLATVLLAGKRQQFVQLTAALEAMSPLAVLARGYSMAFTEDKQILRTVDQVRPGDRFRLITGKGSLDATVDQIKEDAT